MTKTVPELLREGADTYEERNKLYGDNYKRHGIIMSILFPNGAKLHSGDDHNRFGVLTQMVAKLTRYCENWDRGGHADSIHDLIVYSGMLSELDEELKELKGPEAINQPEELVVDWSKLFPEEDNERPVQEGTFRSEAEDNLSAVPASTEPPVVIPEPPQQK